jgi:hypothetical protein
MKLRRKYCGITLNPCSRPFYLTFSELRLMSFKECHGMFLRHSRDHSLSTNVVLSADTYCALKLPSVTKPDVFRTCKFIIIMGHTSYVVFCRLPINTIIWLLMIVLKLLLGSWNRFKTFNLKADNDLQIISCSLILTFCSKYGRFPSSWHVLYFRAPE